MASQHPQTKFFDTFQIASDAAVPAYEQLRSAIVAAIHAGELAAGTQVPPVRKLAADLGLAPGTVAKTYKELETQSFLESRGRSGTFVNAVGDPSEQQARQAAAKYAQLIRTLGITSTEGIRMVEKAFGD